MRTVLALSSVVALAACDEGPVATTGYDLAANFPAAPDHFWKYDNLGLDDVTYWLSQPDASPLGESWTTIRWWSGDSQGLIDDFAGDRALWLVDLHYVERTDGWYWMGWSSNPDGGRADLGDGHFEGDGVPFVMKGATRGRTWTGQALGQEVTLTADEEAEVLEFNGQRIEDAWRLTLESDGDGLPFIGTWWLVGGPGFVQWNAPAFETAQGTPWTHVHNDATTNLLGQTQ